MAIPEVLAVGATTAHIHVSLTTIPVNFAILVVLATPTAAPVDLEKVASFNFFDDQSHGHEIFLDVIGLHQIVKFVDFFVGSVEVYNKDFFGKYWQVFFGHDSVTFECGLTTSIYRQLTNKSIEIHLLILLIIIINVQQLNLTPSQ